MNNQSKYIIQTTDAETENEKGLILKKTAKTKIEGADINSMTT